MPPLLHRSFAERAESVALRLCRDHLRALCALVLLCTLSAACEPYQREPRTLRDLSERIYDARADSAAALVYLAKEEWMKPGSQRLSQIFNRYFVVSRRAADGVILAERFVGDVRDATRETVPTVLGVVDGVLWLQLDTVTRWQLPSLEPVPFAPAEANRIDSIVSSLRDAPWFARPGQAKVWTEVRSARLVYARTPSLRSPPDAFVIAQADDVPWRLESPGGWLAFAARPDDVHRADLLRVTDDETVVWRTPLALDANAAFGVLDLGRHAVFQQRVPGERADLVGVRFWSVDLTTGDVTTFLASDQLAASP